jgi:hypothetical protein
MKRNIATWESIAQAFREIMHLTGYPTIPHCISEANGKVLMLHKWKNMLNDTEIIIFRFLNYVAEFNFHKTFNVFIM